MKSKDYQDNTGKYKKRGKKLMPQKGKPKYKKSHYNEWDQYEDEKSMTDIDYSKEDSSDKY